MTTATLNQIKSNLFAQEGDIKQLEAAKSVNEQGQQGSEEHLQ